MKEAALPSVPKAFHRLLNFLLMVLNCLLTLLLYSLLSVSRSLYIETYSYRETGSFPGPAMADFFLRREFIILPLLLLAFMFLKEFKDRNFKKSIRINLLILAIIFLHAFFIAAVPFTFSLV